MGTKFTSRRQPCLSEAIHLDPPPFNLTFRSKETDQVLNNRAYGTPSTGKLIRGLTDYE